MLQHTIRRPAAALAVVAGAVLLFASACGHAKDHPVTAADPGASGFIGGAPSPTPTGASGNAGDSGGNGTDGGAGAAGNTGSGTGGTGSNGGKTTASKAPSGPTVVYFRIKQQPACPQGTNLDPIPGQDLIVEWKVTGTDKVTLAVDGPGVYASYGAEGSETFAWGCNGQDPGTTVKHTYTLVAGTDGSTAKKVLTASSKVYEIAHV
jgi:hypothetical protein